MFDSRKKKSLALAVGTAILIAGFSATGAQSVWAAPASPSTLAPGGYKPDAATTGVPEGTSLTPYNTFGTDLVITKDGTVLDGLDIRGDIRVQAKNVVIRNSLLRGGAGIPKWASGIVDANSPQVSGLVVEGNTIAPDYPSYNRDGIVGHDYTAKGNNIYGTTDGLGIFNDPGGSLAANVLAEGNYIHDLTYFSKDVVHVDGTHNDGIQVQGGQNIRIVGNTIVASSHPGVSSGPNPRGTQAGNGILLQQNVSKLANVVVENNWVDRGVTSISINRTAENYSNISVTVRENYLGRDQFDFGNGSRNPLRIVDKAGSVVIGLSTNVWEDNGVPLAPGRDTGIRYDG